VLLAFTAACALLGAAWNVRHRDVKHALPLVLQLLFFATPVVWPADNAPAAWRPWLDLNPLAGVCAGLRSAWLPGASPYPHALLPGAAVALGTLLVAAFAFARVERRFADDL
jgi:ABC-type polysaccharide/polyol phosphate export permease